MTREEWLTLIKKIPETMHDQVVFSLSTGIDVYIQRILQLGEQNALVRGRLGGSDEAERIFLVPWPEIRLLFFSRPVGDEVLFNVFGDLIGGIRKSMVTKTAEEEEEELMEEEEANYRPMPAPAAAAPPPKPSGVNLDEVRQRLLQPRKPPPRYETNKPGPGNPSAGGKPIK